MTTVKLSNPAIVKLVILRSPFTTYLARAGITLICEGNCAMLTIIIPAYNEEKRIGASLSALCNWIKESRTACKIIVVSDGTDGTHSVSRRFGRKFPRTIEVLQYPERLGKGGAVLAGLRKCHGAAIMFDADASVRPEQMPLLLSKIGKNDVVIASRRIKGAKIAGRYPFWRVGLSVLFNFYTRLVLGLAYADTQCGYKLFSARAVRLLSSYPFTSKGYEWDVEVLLAAKKLGLRVVEIPIVWKYEEGGKARFKDLLDMVAGLVRLKLEYG